MGGPQERAERRPHTRHAVIPGTETVPTTGRKTKDRYDFRPSGIPEVSLRVEPGSHPRVSKSETGDTLADAKAFKEADALARLHGGNREKLRKKLVPRFRRHKGWRGIVSPPDNLVLRADESVDVFYNASLLRASMNRDAYREVVRRETVVVEFPLPKTVHPEVVTDIMVQAVADIGIRAARAVRVTIKPKVDEELLAKKVNSGEIVLKRGARRLKRRFNLKAETFVKNPPSEQERPE